MDTDINVLATLARNHWVGTVTNLCIDLQYLTSDPNIGREVATAVMKQLQDEADAIVRTAEIVIRRKKQKRVGRGWSGDGHTKFELAETEMHTA